MLNTKKLICSLITVWLALFILDSSCYAEKIEEITVKYKGKGHKSRAFERIADEKTQLTLITKGMRRAGTPNAIIITDWEQYLIDNDKAPRTRCDIKAICMPAIAPSSIEVKDMTNMLPVGNYSGTKLDCKKGEGILVLMIPSKSEDYEYVANLITTSDDDLSKPPIAEAIASGHSHSHGNSGKPES